MSTIQTILSGLRFGGAVVTNQTYSDLNVVEAVKRNRDDLCSWTDEQLIARKEQLKEQFAYSFSESQFADALGLIDEAAYRAAGIRFYDVQLRASIAMLRNHIAEMKTGEGKTYVGAITSFVKSLQGRGVHFMTTNDYLAERDHEIVQPLLSRLKVSVSYIHREMSPAEKREAYQADVTYGPGYEFGFDYLRDQLALINQKKPALGQRIRNDYKNRTQRDVQQMQRELFCAIVDEADSVMIDDATTPLVLSSSMDRPHPMQEPFLLAQEVIESMTINMDYRAIPATRRIELTTSGIESVGEKLTEDVRRCLSRSWTRYIEQALIAKHYFHCDDQYIIRDGKVRMVDSSTGRIFDDRSWSGGLHQAVEAKEGVTITDENSSIARISRQQFFRLYENLCGMTGTAADAQRELRRVYRLPVTVIPTNKPCPRITMPTRVFSTEAAKFAAIGQTVIERHKTGQPVLVGTRTIEKSELIAEQLAGIPFQLLNGKQDAEEADLVAASGQRGAVTIATNMAGRGTDVKLGPGVPELGGLFVVVSEPDHSARVDRQLIGRSSRQGDPGAYQTFLSAEDNVIKQHASWLQRYIERLADHNGEVQADLSHELRTLQQRVERKSAEMRRQMFRKETWLEDALEAMSKE